MKNSDDDDTTAVVVVVVYKDMIKQIQQQII